MKKERMANMELLRIIAMMMVIMMHYLGKGDILPALTGSFTLNGYLAWGLETLSIVAVNVYMLISGYFLCDSSFKSGRLLEIICQILFYSMLIPVVLIAFGVLNFNDLTVYQFLQYIFPVQMEQYWFATAYVILYLVTPILRTAVKHMSRGQLGGTIVLLLLFFSVSKSVLPVALSVDNQGYDAIWFICVFLCAAYIRLYGKDWLGIRSGVLGYLGFCCGIMGITLAIRAVYMTTGHLKDFLGSAYDYNYILNLAAAVCLFCAFYHMEIKNGILKKLILQIAPYTFGVYLIHEQLEIRYLWQGWFGASSSGNPVLFVLRSIGTVIAVFILCTLIDMVRNKLFGLVKKGFEGKVVQRFLLRLDAALNNESQESISDGNGE